MVPVDGLLAPNHACTSALRGCAGPKLRWPAKPLRFLAGASVASLLEDVLQGGHGLPAVSFEYSRQDGRGQPG